MNHLSRTTALLGAFGLFGAAIAVYLLLVKPTYDSAFAMRGQIEATVREIDRKDNLLQTVSELTQRYEGLSDVRGMVALALPADPEIPSLLAQLTTLAQRNFLVVEEIAFDDPDIQTRIAGTGPQIYGYAAIPIEIQLVGSYEHFGSFVRAVESNMRLLDFVEMELSTKSDELTQQGVFDYMVHLQAYVQTTDPPKDPQASRGIRR